MRLDVWLDVACLFKTRSEATRACKAGKVDVNGQGTKPHREIKIGDEVEMRKMARMVAPFTRARGAGAPDRRERKALNRLKGRS